MTKQRLILLCIAVVLGVVALVWAIPKSVLLSTVFEQMYPGIIPASSYGRNLYSSNPDLVRESLSHLADRRNPTAVPRAIELLRSPDDYIWLNAAHYLGACKRQEAVPYLIKALRHTAWRADKETAQYLRDITGEDFGTNFTRWQQWWLARHPNTTLDWESHLGHAPWLGSAPKQ